MVNRFKIYFIALLLSLCSFIAMAQNFPEPQSPPRLINDFASILTANQQQDLEKYLVGFCDTTSNEIALVTVNSLDGMDIAQYATELAQKWGVGSEKNDNGVLMVVKPKTSREKGEIFIAVGYGLEGAIPDVLASRIIREIMIPRFSRGDMFGGIAAGMEQIMVLSSDEYRASKRAPAQSDLPITFIVIAMIIIFSIISSLTQKRSKNSDGSQYGGTIPPIFMFGPTWSGGSRGSSSRGFGGDSFGGFGGFGGGSFGGGGAGGSW